MSMRAVLLLALIFTSSAAGAADRYYVPPSQFSAAFQIMDLKFSNILGTFQNATASFSFDAETKKISDLRIALDASSLSTSNGRNVGDLAELFETRKYPEITFASAAGGEIGVDKKEIKGTLNVHGTAKPFTLEATLNNVGELPGGSGKAVGISLRGSFKRADFGFGDAAEMPGRFGESVALMLELQAIKQ
jgi:polyisoprenoid-binding protein YceI